ncbi:MAG: hypothetical protein H7Z19_07895 [Chitinophagaceae bacterium]|nr:hypothetical protein [Rubrivivax sp.]
MKKASPPPRWFSTWRATRALQHDPADLGTAFGLDLSLRLYGNNDDTPACDPRPAKRSPGWVQRWADRRKPGA